MGNLLQYTLLLIVLITTARCDKSRIEIGSRLENFASFYINEYKTGNVYIHAMQEDEHIRGNILAAIGNGIYTISPSGVHRLLAGSLQNSGFLNAVGTSALFNKTSGLAQLDGGKTLIISDFWNACLRKLDRETNRVTTFAGECNLYALRTNPLTGNRYCAVPKDGYSSGAAFCSPAEMKYDKSANKIYLLDISIQTTYMRAINLATSHVDSIYSNTAFHAHGFILDGHNDQFVFSASPGILRYHKSTGAGTWLAGCDTTKFSGNCSENFKLRQLSTKESHGIIEKNGVYVLADLIGAKVYVVDPKNNALADLCPEDSQPCFRHSVSSLLLKDGYLYIGEAVKPYYLSTDSNVRIRRIKFSVSESVGYTEWLHRDGSTFVNDDKSWLVNNNDYNKPFYWTNKNTYSNYNNEYDNYHDDLDDDVYEEHSSSGFPIWIGGLIGTIVGLICCCGCVTRAVSRKGALPVRTNMGRPVSRLGVRNGTAGSTRSRWWLLMIFRRRQADPECPPPYERLEEDGQKEVSVVKPPSYEESTDRPSLPQSISPSP